VSGRFRVAQTGLTACLLKNDPASASAQRRRPRLRRARQVKWPHSRVQEPWSRSESESEQGGCC
jgi:hypothetical protein